MEKMNQTPEYQKPEVEEVSLITEEEVTGNVIDGKPGVESSIFPF